MKASLIAFVACIMSASALNAQELPGKEELQSRILAHLPSYWTLNEFRIIASAKQGDPINPLALVRYEADVAPKSTLFTPTGESAGPFVIVLETYPKDQSRTLFGTMELSFSGGNWTGAPIVENPVSDLGQPKDLFVKPTLELGSERQKEVLAKIRDDAIAKAQAELQAELSALRAEQEIRVAELRATQEKEIAELGAKHEASVAAMEKNYQSRVDELTQEYETLVAEAQQRLDSEVAKFQATLTEQKSALEEKHRAELAALREEHAEKVGDLIAQQKQEIAELETGFEEKKKRLQSQLTDADVIIPMQNKLAAKIEEIADNRAYLTELIERKRDDRIAFFERLSGKLQGTIECTYPGGENKKSYGRPVTFESKSTNGRGLAGILHLGSGAHYNEYRSNLVMTSEELTYPVEFTISGITRNDYPSVIDLTLSENGKLSGTAASPKDAANCTLTLGQ